MLRIQGFKEFKFPFAEGEEELGAAGPVLGASAAGVAVAGAAAGGAAAAVAAPAESVEAACSAHPACADLKPKPWRFEMFLKQPFTRNCLGFINQCYQELSVFFSSKAEWQLLPQWWRCQTLNPSGIPDADFFLRKNIWNTKVVLGCCKNFNPVNNSDCQVMTFDRLWTQPQQSWVFSGNHRAGSLADLTLAARMPWRRSLWLDPYRLDECGWMDLDWKMLNCSVEVTLPPVATLEPLGTPAPAAGFSMPPLINSCAPGACLRTSPTGRMLWLVLRRSLWSGKQ